MCESVRMLLGLLVVGDRGVRSSTNSTQVILEWGRLSVIRSRF